jgi:hypothetical protein
MLECILVPDAVHIEDEDLLAFHISEDQFRVEHVNCPEHLARDDVGINLLQVLYIDNDATNVSVQITLVEDNLFSMG